METVHFQRKRNFLLFYFTALINRDLFFYADMSKSLALLGNVNINDDAFTCFACLLFSRVYKRRKTKRCVLSL